MIQFNDLNQEDKNEIVCRAFEWQREHGPHVDMLVKYATKSYPPSGHDLNHPKLWTAPHWKWFVTGGENEMVPAL